MNLTGEKADNATGIEGSNRSSGSDNRQSNVFISYSHTDTSLVNPVVKLLRVNQSFVFQDHDTISPGKKWRDSLNEALANSNVVVVFWCGHAHHSEEVRKEWSLALTEGKDIVPLLLDETPLPQELSQYQWLDFRGAIGDAHDNIKKKSKVRLILRALVALFLTAMVTGLGVYFLNNWIDEIKQEAREEGRQLERQFVARQEQQRAEEQQLRLQHEAQRAGYLEEVAVAEQQYVEIVREAEQFDRLIAELNARLTEMQSVGADQEAIDEILLTIEETLEQQELLRLQILQAEILIASLVEAAAAEAAANAALEVPVIPQAQAPRSSANVDSLMRISAGNELLISALALLSLLALIYMTLKGVSTKRTEREKLARLAGGLESELLARTTRN